MRKTDITKNETVVGEHLKFERKDVWDMKWADVSCIVGSLSKSFRASHNSVTIQRRRRFREPKGDVTRDDSQRRFLAQHSVATLEQCCYHSKQCRNNVATLCCARNRRCESSTVTSPLTELQSLMYHR